MFLLLLFIYCGRIGQWGPLAQWTASLPSLLISRCKMHRGFPRLPIFHCASVVTIGFLRLALLPNHEKNRYTSVLSVLLLLQWPAFKGYYLAVRVGYMVKRWVAIGTGEYGVSRRRYISTAVVVSNQEQRCRRVTYVTIFTHVCLIGSADHTISFPLSSWRGSGQSLSQPAVRKLCLSFLVDFMASTTYCAINRWAFTLKEKKTIVSYNLRH